MMDALDYRVGCAWEPGDTSEAFNDMNPSDTRDVVTRFRYLSAAQVLKVLDAAAAAAPDWRAAAPIERGAILSRAAQILRASKAEIAHDVSRENGKTIGEATVEVEKSADFLDFYAATARIPLGTLIADGRRNVRVMTVIEPVGVVLAITPYNDPILTPARKLAPALIAGNPVILKVADHTPLAAYHITRALCDAGLPGGVIGTVMTDRRTLNDILIGDPRIAAVSFTGSTKVGLELQRQLAGRHVRLQAEMGGKNASVVMADADLDLAIPTLAAASFAQAGQRCTATSRIVVEASIYDEVVRRLSAAAQSLRMGISTDPATQIGPVVSEEHRSDIFRHIDRAKKDGAQLVAGGGASDMEELRHGYFVAPTVLANVTRIMPIWRDEVFGPVIAVHPVESFEEAVRAVNHSNYGLSASIFTTSLSAAQRFVDETDTGQVAVNLPTSGWDVHQPFGGFKASGSAFKEQGVEGLRFYTRIKTAAVRFGI